MFRILPLPMGEGLLQDLTLLRGIFSCRFNMQNLKGFALHPKGPFDQQGLASSSPSRISAVQRFGLNFPLQLHETVRNSVRKKGGPLSFEIRCKTGEPLGMPGCTVWGKRLRKEFTPRRGLRPAERGFERGAMQKGCPQECTSLAESR